MTTLHTERLTLRPIDMDADFEAFAEAYADADTMRFIGGSPLSRAGLALGGHDHRPRRGARLRFSILHRQDDRCLGRARGAVVSPRIARAGNRLDAPPRPHRQGLRHGSRTRLRRPCARRFGLDLGDPPDRGGQYGVRSRGGADRFQPATAAG